MRQFFWLSALFFLGMMLLLVYFYKNLSVSLLHEHERDAQDISEIGMGVIRYFHRLQIVGDLSEAEAKRLAAEALENATYVKNGYYWINLGNGNLYMQPHTPERVGVNQIDWTDVKGKPIFQEFIRVAKQGGGWVEYHWPKPHGTTEFRKVSYVDYFAPWNWILGTGKYLDDIRQETGDVLSRASTIALVLLCIFIAFSIFFARQLINQLNQLAIHDSLTGLYRRQFLIDSIPTILKQQNRNKNRLMAIVFMDIDHFKRVNDRYGHMAGDKVLSTIAKEIMEHSRPDDLCIRYGGEEFVVVGLFDGESAIMQFAERLRSFTPSVVFKQAHESFSVTLSAGVAIFRAGEESFDEALKRADGHLYQAKEAGRDRVVM
ncbi:MAG: diguanylate cyclase [Candidatus Thiodiazotropha sp.]